jgi:hypothetical protein
MHVSEKSEIGMKRNKRNKSMCELDVESLARLLARIYVKRQVVYKVGNKIVREIYLLGVITHIRRTAK